MAWLADLAGVPPAELLAVPEAPPNAGNMLELSSEDIVSVETLAEVVESALAKVDNLAERSTVFEREIAILSREMSELERRSSSLHYRLAARKSAESVLTPIVAELALPPAIIREIWQGSIGPQWRAALSVLDRSRTLPIGEEEGRASRESARLRKLVLSRAAQRAKDWWIIQLRKLRRPLMDAQVVQQDLINNAAVFAFLLRRVPRLAVALRQAYTNTVRWYYRMLFFKYGDWLAKQPVTPAGPTELLGDVATKLSTPRGFFGGASTTMTAASEAFSVGSRPGVLLESGTLPRNHNYVSHHVEIYVRSLVVTLVDSARMEREVLETLYPTSPVSNSEEAAGIDDSVADVSVADITVGTIRDESTDNGNVDSEGGPDDALKAIFDPVLVKLESILKRWIGEIQDPFALLLIDRLVTDYCTTFPSFLGFVSGVKKLICMQFSEVVARHSQSIEAASLKPVAPQQPGPHPLTQLTASLLAGLLQLCPAERPADEMVSSSLRGLAEAYEMYITKLGSTDTVRYTNYFVLAAIIGDVPGPLSAELANHFQLLVDAYNPK